ncbi:hypothetical protein AHAS_Ahas07G0077100 [Arachis hypogaea]
MKVYGRGTPRAGCGTLVQFSKRAMMKATTKAWHAKVGVAHQNHQPLWACHLKHGVWHASSSIQRSKHLGVPLGIEGVARQALLITWACHLRTQAWHAKLKEGHLKVGVPLEHYGMAR